MSETFNEITKPTWSEHVALPFCDDSLGNRGPNSEEAHHDIEPSAASSDSDSDESTSNAEGTKSGLFIPPPSIDDAKAALVDITIVLQPKRVNGNGHKPFTEGSDALRLRLTMMKMHLAMYTAPDSPGWITASLKTAHSFQKSSHTAKKLRSWARSFVADRNDLPKSLCGSWNVSLLDKGELAKEIHLHLMGIGKYVKAMDIVHFLDTPDVKQRYGLKKKISLSTARRWMHMMDYRWTKAPSGQYVDGHEREDVVTYRQSQFLPTMADLEWNLRVWKDGLQEITSSEDRRDPYTVIWWHDESTFYAHDRRKVYWVHKDETAVPRPKGEGASLMVADFVSADYGWLRFHGESARVLFKAGKNREGYFTNTEILAQVTAAMDILDKHAPLEKHIFMFDNATTHLKRADDALSARKMPKNPSPSKAGNLPFGVERTVIGSNGKRVYAPDGKLLKERVQMANAAFSDGRPQALYFPPGHPQAGSFKGMAIILEERGFTDARKLRSECLKFDCPKGTTNCCCRRLLYTQPDFAQVESLLETLCKSRGYSVHFLPKFHCELNFIEQCWGHAKRTYWLNPLSSSEADLERNVVTALDSVPLVSMRRYVCIVRSHQWKQLITGTACSADLPLVHFVSWMHIVKGSPENKPHGQTRSTVATVSSQTTFLKNWQRLVFDLQPWDVTFCSVHSNQSTLFYILQLYTHLIYTTGR
jgi:hypothetical protein